MPLLAWFRKFLTKNKLGRYFLLGSFTFFLIKGLVWLVIFFIAGFSLINFG